MKIAVLSVSDTRTLENDVSGLVLANRLQQAGHELVIRTICKDEAVTIQKIVSTWIKDKQIDVILTTGGTGLTTRDITPDAVSPLFEKNLTGFSTIFHQISYQKIGPSTIQSRVTAGLANSTYIFVLPGSPSACRDAWDNILVYQLDPEFKPCNLVEIKDRLKKE